MSVQNFIPTIWSARLLQAFRKTYVFRDLVNTDYEGEITQAGDTVKITTPGAVTVSDYAGTVSYETIQSTQQSLLIDQDKYWAFEVDDADKVQANVNLIDTYAMEAANSLADAVDQNLAALYTAAAHTVALDISSAFTGVRAALVEAGRKLDEANVPSQGRWMVLSPIVMAGIRLAGDYTPASEMGDELRRSGSIGFLEGFSLYLSNNIVVATQHKCLFGTNQAITFTEQLVETEAIRLQAKFADAVRGRMVFGRKVVRPAALGVLNTTVS